MKQSLMMIMALMVVWPAVSVEGNHNPHHYEHIATSTRITTHDSSGFACRDEYTLSGDRPIQSSNPRAYGECVFAFIANAQKDWQARALPMGHKWARLGPPTLLLVTYLEGLQAIVETGEDIAIVCHVNFPTLGTWWGKTCEELGLPPSDNRIERKSGVTNRLRPGGRSYPTRRPPPPNIPNPPGSPGTGPGEDPEPQEEPESPQEPVGNLEVPSDGSFQSGIGYVSGWVCDGARVSIVIDGGLHLPPVARNIGRGDTEAICGDRDNGFILHWNWNLMGDGTYTAALVVDGQTIQSNTFTVTTLGEEFIRGIERDVVVNDFPAPGETARFRWQEPVQGLVLVPPTD